MIGYTLGIIALAERLTNLSSAPCVAVDRPFRTSEVSCLMHVFLRSFIALFLAVSQFPSASAADTPPAEKKTAEAKLIEIKRGHVPSYPRVITGKITDVNGNPVS